jgi:uncharacterized delta-60 repeat protein
MTVAALGWVLFQSTELVANPGDLDPSFNGAGMVLAPVRSESEAYAVAIQTDGKIVVAGHSEFDFAVARFHPDGTPDTLFNGTGSTVTEVGAGFNEARAIAIQDDGKILLAGHSTGTTADSTLVRYLPGGTTDPSFDGDGIKIQAFSGLNADRFEDVVLQSDGKIVAAGTLNDGSSVQMFLARFETDGDLDSTSFGLFGLNVDTFPGHAEAFALAVRADDRLLLGGGVGPPSAMDFAIVAYQANGQVDTTFGSSGQTTTSVGTGDDRIADLAIQADGRIVAAGYAFDSSGFSDIAIVRYLANGSPDPSFGGDGIVITRLGDQNDFAEGVAIQPDGKIVVAGTSVVTGGRDFIVLRYRPDGTLDATFGNGGVVRTPIGASPRTAYAVAIQDDGRIVAAGREGGLDFAIARYRTAQGDMRIGRTVALRKGDDLYHPGGRNQHLDLVLRNRANTPLRLGVQNDGSVADRFHLRGARRAGPFSLTYRNGTRNLTAAIASGRFLSDPVPAGRILGLKATIKSAAAGSWRRQIPVTATSASDALAIDRVLIRAR